MCGFPMTSSGTTENKYLKAQMYIIIITHLLTFFKKKMFNIVTLIVKHIWQVSLDSNKTCCKFL